MSTTLSIRWSTSRARDTDGYPVCTVIDESTGKRYSCMGGGYDLIGTSFGHWLTDTHQQQLRTLADQHGPSKDHRGQVADHYGMYRWEADGPVKLDGGCGLESMMRIAKAIGLEVERTFIRDGARRGETTGWIVSTPTDPQVHTFTITVSGCTAEEAGRVMAERIDHDEDYGFPYRIAWGA